MALYRQDSYRRTAEHVFLARLYQRLDWRLLVSLAVIAGVAAISSLINIGSAAATYEILQLSVVALAIFSGATIFSAERNQGTFELLWLAIGSERRVLWFLFSVETFYFLVQVALFVALFSYFSANIWSPVSFGLTLSLTGLFVLAVMTFLSVILSQSWTAGIVGLILVGTTLALGYESTSLLYPFSNPVLLETSVPGNRWALAVLSYFFLRSAAARLRRHFSD